MIVAVHKDEITADVAARPKSQTCKDVP